MKIRCLFGHNWRDVPWFKSRAGHHDNISNPYKICLRCFKQVRKQYVLVIRSAEGQGWGYYMPPYWEGQSVPPGYESWSDYHRKSRDALLGRIR